MAAANYKLQIMPTEDVIVGDKYFASKFLMEALYEIEGLTNEVGTQIQELSAVRQYVVTTQMCSY